MASSFRTAFVVTAIGLLIATAGGCSARDSADSAGESRSIAVGGEAFLTRCEANGAPKAVVATISALDEVRVLSQQGGTLVDGGLRIPGITKPRQVALRSDGKEAVVAWGTVQSNWGIAVLALAADGSSVSLASLLTLGDHHTPFALSYAGNDRVVVNIAGPTDELVTLDRISSPDVFTEKARIASPGAFAHALLGTGDPSELVLSHVKLGTEAETSIERLRADANGAFVSQGAIGFVGPASVHTVLHPSGKVAYAQTYDLADAPTLTDPNGTGVLNVFGIDASGVNSSASVRMPKIGGALAVDPQGRFLVLQQNKIEPDPATGTLITRSYSLGTATLGPRGEVLGLVPEGSPPMPGLLFDDMVVTSSSHLLIARTMYPNTVPAADQEHPLEVLAQSRAGAWEVCQRVYLPGGSKIAIAP